MTLQANRLESLKSIREDIHGKLKPLQTQLVNLDISQSEKEHSIAALGNSVKKSDNGKY